MAPFKLKIDIFSEFERICNFNYGLFIYGQSINELNNIIKKQHGKDKRAAQFALKLIKIKDIRVIEPENSGDRNNEDKNSENKDVDSLILSNLGKDTLVATQDLHLKRQLLEKRVPVIIVRQKKYLEIKNH